MYNLVATGACCCINCCCQECSAGLKRLLGPEKVTKLFYLILVIFFTVPAIIIFFFLNEWQSFIDYFSRWISCPGREEGDQ